MDRINVSRLYKFILSPRFNCRPQARSFSLLYGSVFLLFDFLLSRKHFELKLKFRKYVLLEKNRKRSLAFLSTSDLYHQLIDRVSMEGGKFTACLYSFLHKLDTRTELRSFRQNPKQYLQKFQETVVVRRFSTIPFPLIKLPDVAFAHLLTFLSNRDRLSLLLSSPQIFIYYSKLFRIDFEGLSDFMPSCVVEKPFEKVNNVCFCRICNVKCPCRPTFIDEHLPTVRFMFDNFRFRNVAINSQRLFDLVFRDHPAEFHCQKMTIGFSLSFLDMLDLKKCVAVNELEFGLALDTIVHPLMINFPSVQHLTIRLKSNDYSLNVISKSRMLTRIIKRNITRLKSLKFSGFPSNLRFFPLSVHDPAIQLFQTLSRLVLDKAVNITCTQFVPLLTHCQTLTEFALTNTNIHSLCNKKHFAPFLRSDKYNFAYTDRRLQRVSRTHFLSIKTDPQLKCSDCTDVSTEKYVKFNVYRVIYCERCLLPVDGECH